MDIFLNPAKIFFITNDMFIIIPLPTKQYQTGTMTLSCYGCFVGTNDRSERLRCNVLKFISSGFDTLGFNILNPNVVFNNNYSMHVVRHHDVFIQFHVLKMVWNIQPALPCNGAFIG